MHYFSERHDRNYMLTFRTPSSVQISPFATTCSCIKRAVEMWNALCVTMVVSSNMNVG